MLEHLQDILGFFGTVINVGWIMALPFFLLALAEISWNKDDDWVLGVLLCLTFSVFMCLLSYAVMSEAPWFGHVLVSLVVNGIVFGLAYYKANKEDGGVG